jgi:hypothetical protein
MIPAGIFPTFRSLALVNVDEHALAVDGTVYKFTTKTMPMSIGEVARELHPYKGWVGGKK